MPTTHTAIYLHVVFSTKHRVPLIAPELRPRLHGYMGGIVRGMNGHLLSAGGVEDHMHLLVHWNTKGADALLREVKSKSTKWMHGEFPELRGFYWQAGGGVFSVSKSEVGRVEKYIAGQESHHRRRTFKEEYLEFLHKHEVEYDERYVWD